MTSLKMTSLRVTGLLYCKVNLSFSNLRLATPKIQDLCSFKELFISMDGYKTIVYKKRKGFDFDDIDQSLCIYSTSKQAYELGM